MRWAIGTALGALLLAPILPAHAQQVDAGPGDDIDVSGQTVTTVGVPALKAHDGGRIFNTPGVGNEVSVNTSGFAAHGGEASAGGIINLDGGGTITTTGNISIGLLATGAGSTITSIADVTTSGDNAVGAYAQTAGTMITLNGGVITTNGIHANGLTAQGGSVTSAAMVVTNNFGGQGAAVTGNGSIILTGGSITTKGDNANGLFIDATGGTITSVVDITTHGLFSSGARAEGGTITLTGGTITTTGPSAHGLLARTGGVVNATGVTVNVTGPTTAAVAVVEGGTLTLTNSTATSAQELALASQAQTGLTNTFIITDSTLSTLTNTAMAFQGGLQQITLIDSQVLSGNGQLLQVAQRVIGPDTFPTQFVMDATGSTLVGDMQVLDPGINTADVTLGQGTIWTGASQAVTNLTLAGSTWNVTGPSTITDTLSNGGAIAFQWAGAFNTITAANYVGNGGTINFNAALAGDASLSDKLIIDGGSATGTTGVIVTNQGGPGAQTTGNGIPVVVAEGGATSTASAFNLAGPVGAGPFQYLLFRGPQGAGTADEQNSWYLRSHTDPDGEGGNPPIPLYRPETASYALFPALARGLAVSSIGTFHERNGDQALAGGSKRERLWGRIFGEHSERSHGGHVTPSFEGHAAGFQAGADVYETIWDNGVRGRTGLFVGWAEARGDIKGFVLGSLQAFAGDAQLEATSVGGYGTLIGPGGWYLDSILMTSFYSGDGRSTNGIGVNADGWSLLGSLEAGMPFRLGGGFTLEPQAQLIYQHLSFDDAADPFSTVRFNTPDAVSGRIGVRLAAELAGGRWRPYLKANIWQDWLDKDGVIYAGTHRLDTEHGGTAVEVGGGLVAELMPGVGVWGVIDYTSDIAGDTERETLRGNAGVRITW